MGGFRGTPRMPRLGPRFDAAVRAQASAYTLIETAKLNDIDPPPWLADVLARAPIIRQKRIHELLPWN